MKELELPETLGAMILPGAVLFPGSLLPLYIFEPRYREMLELALGSHRMFAIAIAREGGGAHPVGGAGIVRACVKNDDGTSNLILEGLVRVRFEDWLEDRSYPHAVVRPFASTVSDAGQASALRRGILASIEKIVAPALPAHVANLLRQCEHPAAFSDLAASCLVADDAVRRRLLEEPDALLRLEILASYLVALQAVRG